MEGVRSLFLPWKNRLFNLKYLKTSNVLGSNIFYELSCAVINDNCIFAAAKDKNLSDLVNGRVAQLDRASAF